MGCLFREWAFGDASCKNKQSVPYAFLVFNGTAFEGTGSEANYITMKNLHLWFLFIVLLSGIFPAGAYSFQVDGIYYEVTGNEASVTSKTGGVSNSYSGDVVIPSTVSYEGNTYSVTSIGWFAFSDCSDLTAITLPNTITSIGWKAFSECSRLTSIILPPSLTAIEYMSFSGCSGLTSVSIPDEVTTIGEYAFYACTGLSTVEIGNSVTSIDNYAFENCIGLTAVTIPDAVESIGTRAFSNCRSLTMLSLGNSVERIGNGAFVNCIGLTAVTIPNSVTSIGSSAFSGCSGLTSITIPESVANIEAGAFGGCSSLGFVEVSEENPYYSSVEGVLYDKDKTTLYFCPVVKTEVRIPETVTTIGNGAFEDCIGLTEVIIPNSVKTIGNNAFENCSGLTEVTIPNSVTNIGTDSFRGCSKLEEVTIPEGVMSIGEAAFFDCTALTTIVSKAVTPPTVYWGTFIQSHYENATLYVPAGSKSAYQKASYWSNFTNIMESPTGVESVDNNDMRVYAAGHTLYVEHVDEAYRVYTAMGQLVYAGDESTVLLPGAGLYIVCAGNRSQKVWVK